MLNPQQAEAVKNNSNPLLVLAGAGSGKTTLLTTKYSYLVKKEGLSPSSILAVTFTNKAANEMKERIETLINIRKNTPWISTFHAFGTKVLRRFIDKIGYSKDFSIYDDSEQKNFIKKLLKRDFSYLDKNKFPEGKVINFINHFKNRGMFPEDVEVQENYTNNILKKIYSTYQETMKVNNSSDFADLLLLTYKLLNEHQEIFDYFQHIFDYILVDEYQDTNHIQYKIIKLLSKNKKRICVVGDDDQSIYSWRGATVDNILKFEQDFPDAKVIKLEENYRSTKNILNAANHLISKNIFRKKKNLWTAGKSGEKIKLFTAQNEYEEARFVVNKLQSLTDLGDTAILYRTNAQSRVIEDELVRSSIPYKIVGGFKFFDRKEVKDIITYLKLINGSEDTLCYERVINTPNRGIGERSFEKLVELSYSENKSLFEIFENISESTTKFTSKASAGIKNFYNILSKFRNMKGTIPLFELTYKLLNEINYTNLFETFDPIERENKEENLQELISSIKNFEITYPEATLTDYLDTVSLASSMDTPNRGDSVNLMTIHSAKGLEFKNIFLIGFEDDIIPHANSKINPQNIEEERRLSYVAITRAKENLFISFCNNRNIGRVFQRSNPSPFLSDIPHNLIEIVNKGSEDFIRNIPYSSHNRDNVTDTTNQKSIRSGVTVKHKTFGIGKVISVIGKGEEQKIIVSFNNFGLKTLLTEKAGLTIL